MGLQDQNQNKNQNNDASLQDICLGLWKQKWLILALTLIGLLISLAYLKVAQPVYEAQVLVNPPLLSQIQALNVGRSYSKRAPLSPIMLTSVYQTFITSLNSDDVKSKFFVESYVPSLSQIQQKLPRSVLFEKYLNAVTIKKDIFSVPNGLEKYSISARTNQPELSQQWVEQHLLLGDKKAHVEVKDMVNTQNSDLVKYNQWMLATLQTMNQQASQQSAVNYAQASAPTVIANANIQDAMQDVTQATANIPLQNSMPSTNDLATINLQRELQAESKIYSNIDLSSAEFQMYRMDGEIMTSLIWPNQKLIIFLGLFGGLMLGGLMAVVRNYIRVR